ncbi:DUF2786 domain-containing protein [Acetobacter lovaniensis]|jgi:DNA-binding NtrC family response regulator|uniref:DUF2786 domain-containing protein n=1 Tax=Acetobacter lovaniensis TaxID=104100 RepID=UPI0020A01835|nr:DUF2786 domain-containing protein [Acetobacter lovaniensis]MCI1796572.1 DUF2786 domain-containing protein [Acetobacter lovaniensis]MCP1240922.1 DUF2786 domain-containing protein [Acetobacter lovaniensis]
MSKKAIMERLKKLMALSRSSNVHEAAAAMERATQLMQEHQITEDDLVLSNVTECNTSFAWGTIEFPAKYAGAPQEDTQCKPKPSPHGTPAQERKRDEFARLSSFCAEGCQMRPPP